MHGRWQRRGGGGRWLSWMFILDTDIVDRGLIVLSYIFCFFFGLFSDTPPWKRLNSAIFRFFLLLFVFFSVGSHPLKRGLIVLFLFFFAIFGHFFWCSPPWKRFNSAIFRSFLLFFGIFSIGPPEKCSADTLVEKWPFSGLRVNLHLLLPV